MDEVSLQGKAVFFIVLLVSITMHEFGHAFAADRLGDPMPRAMGRVTLNPMAHADKWGTIILPLILIFSGSTMLFGWGKPVYVSLPNPKTRMRDDLLSTLAGPGMNLLLALTFTIILTGGALYGSKEALEIGRLGLMVNCMLFVFNMIPIPPLDGSHFLRYALNISNEAYVKLEQYGFIVLFALILFVDPFRHLLGLAINYLASAFVFAAAKIIELAS